MATATAGAANDLKAVNDLLATDTPDPTPTLKAKPKPRPVAPVGPIGELEDEASEKVFDPRAGHSVRMRKVAPAPEPVNDDALPEPRNLRLSLLPTVPPIRPAAPGFPDPEQDPKVIAGRATANKLTNDLRTALEELAALETALDILPNTPPRTLEALAVRMLADGGDDAQIERLKVVAVRVDRLTRAARMAAEGVGAMLAEARRKLTAEATARIMDPLNRDVASAVLALLTKLEARRAGAASICAAGMGDPPGLFYRLDPSTTGQNPDVAHLVFLELLTREEVRAALPHLQGV